MQIEYFIKRIDSIPKSEYDELIHSIEDENSNKEGIEIINKLQSSINSELIIKTKDSLTSIIKMSNPEHSEIYKYTINVDQSVVKNTAPVPVPEVVENAINQVYPSS